MDNIYVFLDINIVIVTDVRILIFKNGFFCFFYMKLVYNLILILFLILFFPLSFAEEKTQDYIVIYNSSYIEEVNEAVGFLGHSDVEIKGHDIRDQVFDSLEESGVGVFDRKNISREFERVGGSGGFVVDLDEETKKLLEDLQEIGGVYENRRVETLLQDTNEIYNISDVWGVDEYLGDCEESDKSCLRGKNISIGVIDTGVDYTHPDLGGCSEDEFLSRNCSKVVGGYNFVDDDNNNPMDYNGHGTHVASIAAGNGSLKGMAPDAEIYAYKALDDSGGGDFDDILLALEKAVEDDVDVVVMSLGSHCGDEGSRRGYDEYCGGPEDILSNKVNQIVEKNDTFVSVAAGNSGTYEDVATPGVAENALTVGSVNKSGLVSSFSSRGPIIYGNYSNREHFLKPDLVAVGGNVNASVPWGYTFLSGTSMSAPHVAGMAALLRQQDSKASAFDIKDRLLQSARGTYSIFDAGYGEVDIVEALRYNISSFDNVSIDENSIIEEPYTDIRGSVIGDINEYNLYLSRINNLSESELSNENYEWKKLCRGLNETEDSLCDVNLASFDSGYYLFKLKAEDNTNNSYVDYSMVEFNFSEDNYVDQIKPVFGDNYIKTPQVDVFLNFSSFFEDDNGLYNNTKVFDYYLKDNRIIDKRADILEDSNYFNSTIELTSIEQNESIFYIEFEDGSNMNYTIDLNNYLNLSDISESFIGGLDNINTNVDLDLIVNDSEDILDNYNGSYDVELSSHEFNYSFIHNFTNTDVDLTDYTFRSRFDEDSEKRFFMRSEDINSSNYSKSFSFDISENFKNNSALCLRDEDYYYFSEFLDDECIGDDIYLYDFSNNKSRVVNSSYGEYKLNYWIDDEDNLNIKREILDDGGFIPGSFAVYETCLEEWRVNETAIDEGKGNVYYDKNECGTDYLFSDNVSVGEFFPYDESVYLESLELPVRGGFVRDVGYEYLNEPIKRAFLILENNKEVDITDDVSNYYLLNTSLQLSSYSDSNGTVFVEFFDENLSDRIFEMDFNFDIEKNYTNRSENYRGDLINVNSNRDLILEDYIGDDSNFSGFNSLERNDFEIMSDDNFSYEEFDEGVVLNDEDNLFRTFFYHNFTKKEFDLTELTLRSDFTGDGNLAFIMRSGDFNYSFRDLMLNISYNRSYNSLCFIDEPVYYFEELTGDCESDGGEKIYNVSGMENYSYENNEFSVKNENGILEFFSDIDGESSKRGLDDFAVYSMCSEEWEYGEWSDCEDGVETREPYEVTSCGTDNFKPPVEERSCDDGSDESSGGGSSGSSGGGGGGGSSGGGGGGFVSDEDSDDEKSDDVGSVKLGGFRDNYGDFKVRVDGVGIGGRNYSGVESVGIYDDLNYSIIEFDYNFSSGDLELDGVDIGYGRDNKSFLWVKGLENVDSKILSIPVLSDESSLCVFDDREVSSDLVDEECSYIGGELIDCEESINENFSFECSIENDRYLVSGLENSLIYEEYYGDKYYENDSKDGEIADEGIGEDDSLEDNGLDDEQSDDYEGVFIMGYVIDNISLIVGAFVISFFVVVIYLGVGRYKNFRRKNSFDAAFSRNGDYGNSSEKLNGGYGDFGTYKNTGDIYKSSFGFKNSGYFEDIPKNKSTSDLDDDIEDLEDNEEFNSSNLGMSKDNLFNENSKDLDLSDVRNISVSNRESKKKGEFSKRKFFDDL